jgi:hypothetical protein
MPLVSIEHDAIDRCRSIPSAGSLDGRCAPHLLCLQNKK